MEKAPMVMRKLIFWISLFLSLACWFGGCASVGQWQGMVLALLLGLFWLDAWRLPASLETPLCLVASIILGTAGILEGVQPWLMICGAAAALVAWDTLLMISVLKSSISEEKNRQYESAHLKLLLLAVGGGLFTA
jgi:hypothetical protein